MQKANELPQSKLSHCKIRLNIADVRTVSVVEQHIRTVSALSVLPTYSLHNLRPLCVLSLRSLSVVSVLPPRLDVHPLKCHPYCVRDVRTAYVLSPQPPYSLLTLSVVSTRSPCCLRRWTSILSNVIRTVSATSVLSPHLHPLLSAAIRGQFGPICPSAAASVLAPYPYILSPPILANINTIPYWLRTLYARFRPYSIRSDPRHPCVGVKGV